MAAIIFLSQVTLVMAGPPLGMPSITNTEEGKWVKNKIHDAIEKYGKRHNNKILREAAKIMRGAGWDKEENQRLLSSGANPQPAPELVRLNQVNNIKILFKEI